MIHGSYIQSHVHKYCGLLSFTLMVARVAVKQAPCLRSLNFLPQFMSLGSTKLQANADVGEAMGTVHSCFISC